MTTGTGGPPDLGSPSRGRHVCLESAFPHEPVFKTNFSHAGRGAYGWAVAYDLRLGEKSDICSQEPFQRFRQFVRNGKRATLYYTY
jgi:hypothetical protein